jgi:hypothetical protein
MRPVKKLNDVYYNNSLNLTRNIGYRKAETKCLAFCIDEEINRLRVIIAGLPIGGGVEVIATAIIGKVDLAAIPVTIPKLIIPAVPAAGGFAGFAGGVYDAAIRTLAANRALVDNYIHYRIIQRNLNYDIANDTFPGNVSRLVIADIPYAASAMQDARERVRAVGGGIFRAAGVVNIGVFPLGVPNNSKFTLSDINRYIKTLYNDWSTEADRQGSLSPYTDAARELVNQLGPYCAYCEANLKTQIDVEHMLPKGTGQIKAETWLGFPSHAKSWLNFLPACPRCNSTKNAHPGKYDITYQAAGVPFIKDDNTVLPAIVGVGKEGDRRITDLEYARLYQDYYQFPLEAASYRNVGFALWNQSLGVIDNTAIAKQINWTINAVDEINKVVIVNQFGHLPAVVPYQVFIDDGTYAAAVVQTPGPPANVVKVRGIKNICGLNTTNANTDRRVLERTEAWFMALEAVRRIQIDLAGLNGLPLGLAAPNVYNGVYWLWCDNVINTIKEKGFISVWLKIFAAFHHPLTGTPGTVPTFPALLTGDEVGGAVPGGLMNLAQAIATQIKNSRYFPNTNFTTVP